jgi:hypothetical protein
MGNLNLALTTVGDLLICNRITQQKDGGSIQNIELVIPEYQRPYKWAAKNANQLLDDILESQNNNKEVYRVGTLILHKTKDKEGNVIYEIVDGLQRTITFCLLLKCLDSNVKIRFLEQPLSSDENNAHNISSNFLSLKRRVENKELESAQLNEYIKNHCEMIVVITDDVSEAFQFFDSQNARGKTLYPHDLLKAYHLREMRDLSIEETEKIVNTWEDHNQKDLSALFSEYLYRIKEWVKGNRADGLNEHNMDMFKGVASKDNYPYAQFYKGAFAYADHLNNSSIPFVMGIQKLNPFQITTPIVAGKPFFDYAKHYFAILADIQNNDKYEGYFINDNEIVKTLDLPKYKRGVGNRITRLLFDSAILLYVDRFCPEQPTTTDLELLNQFVIYAFIWAYSMRAQFVNVGWQTAQNYVLGSSLKEVVNSFNIYKVISESNSPVLLLSSLADKISPLPSNRVVESAKNDKSEFKEKNDDGIQKNYLNLFMDYSFWSEK